MTAAAVPVIVRTLAEEVFPPEHVAVWWVTSNRMLDGTPPEKVWLTDKKRVLNYLNAIAEGNFA